MKTEHIFYSVEQMLDLQELGMNISDAACRWMKFVRKNGKKSTKWKVRTTTAKELNERTSINVGHFVDCPAYTLQELKKKLPYRISKDGKEYKLSMFIAEQPDGTMVHEYEYYCCEDGNILLGGYEKSEMDVAYKVMHCLLTDKLMPNE